MKRLFALLLLASAPLPLAAAEPFTPAQEEAIGRHVREYLMKHPEVIIEALEAAEARAKAEAAERAQAALKAKRRDLEQDPGSPVLGNPKGDVTLVEFFDYRCPYCKQVAPSLMTLIGEDKQLRIVMKELPVLGRESVVAARAALAAERQGKYIAFHNAMMGLKGQLSEDIIFKTAGSVGLDVEKLKADMKRPEVEQQLRDTYELAQALEIRGTPAFVVGGEIVPGAVDVGTLRRKIAEARKAG